MELRDLIVTPLVLIIVYVAAYFIRPWVTDPLTRRYFFPALTVRIIGALAVGFIYQFYYSGGDTFGYHRHGSRVVWNAFVESPALGLKLIFTDGSFIRGSYDYISAIWFFDDPSSYFIVRIASLFDLITFSSYSATAVLFSILSFSGGWVMFQVFYRMLPQRVNLIALATLFVPSVVFWGSGILKDSVTLSAVGWATFAVYSIFIVRRFSGFHVAILVLSCFVLYAVKIYILLCFLPAVILWFFLSHVGSIRSAAVRILVAPIVILLSAWLGYKAIEMVGEGNKKYALENLARTARVTAYDIGFYTGRSAGSRYSLGELDDSFSGMLRKAPQAINVTLFRPYLWEVKNVLMLISAIESLVILSYSFLVLVRARSQFFSLTIKPVILFCLSFSLAFAFAVGVSTYNFGTLVRYKIPLISFFLIALIFIDAYSKSAKNKGVTDSTE